MGNTTHRGKVKWYDLNKGFGFIQSETGEEVFCHYSAIRGRGYRSLEAGDVVEFEVEEGTKGLIAHKVMRVSTRFTHQKPKR